MHAFKNDEEIGKALGDPDLGKVLGGMARAAQGIGEDAKSTGVNPFDGPAPASVAGSVAIAFQVLDDLDEEMGSLKSKASTQYAVLEAAGIPRKVARLARQVSAMTDSERRAFDASLTLARNYLGVQTEMDLGSP